MKTKFSIKKLWRRIRVFMIWMQLHHFKNFIMFWLRVGIILVALVTAVGIWFTDKGSTVGIFISIGCVFGALVFYMGGKRHIKRIHKKYVIYARKLKQRANNLRSMFGKNSFRVLIFFYTWKSYGKLL